MNFSISVMCSKTADGNLTSKPDVSVSTVDDLEITLSVQLSHRREIVLSGGIFIEAPRELPCSLKFWFIHFQQASSFWDVWPEMIKFIVAAHHSGNVSLKLLLFHLCLVQIEVMSLYAWGNSLSSWNNFIHQTQKKVIVELQRLSQSPLALAPASVLKVSKKLRNQIWWSNIQPNCSTTNYSETTSVDGVVPVLVLLL